MQNGKRYTVSVEERPDSPCWQARMYLEGEHGRARRWSTGVAVGNDKRVSKRLATSVAEARADQIARQVHGEVGDDDKRYTLESVGKRMVLAKVADGRRKGAVYMIGLNFHNHVKGFFGAERDVRTIARKDLEAFKQYLRARGLAETTINGALTAIRQTLKHACNVDEMIESVPYVGNVPVPKRSKVAMPITAEQAKKYLDSFSDPDARDFNLFLINTGLRKTESLAIRWDWIDWDNCELRIPGEHRKGGKEQRVPTALNPTVMALLERLRQRPKQPSKNRVFWQLTGGSSKRRGRDYDKLRHEAAAKAKIAGFRHHDARHSRASWLGASGASEIDLRDAMNWETFAMVSRYTHPRRERVHQLAAAVELSVTDVTGSVTGEQGPRGGDRGTSVNQGNAASDGKIKKSKGL